MRRILTLEGMESKKWGQCRYFNLHFTAFFHSKACEVLELQHMDQETLSRTVMPEKEVLN